MTRYPGNCHCGAVRFEVELEDEIDVRECNCSICNMVGQPGAIACPNTAPKKARAWGWSTTR